MIAIGVDCNASRRHSVSGRGRGSAAIGETALGIMDVNTSSSMGGILINRVLHLAEEIVDLDEVLVRAGIRDGEIVLLGEGVVRWSRSGVDSWPSLLRNVLLCGSHGAGGDGERAMERQQGAANLSIGSGIDLAAFGAAKEVIDHLKGALAVITTRSGAVAEVLGPGIVQGRLVEVKAIVCRRLGRIVAIMPSLVIESRSVSAHLAIVVIIARRTLMRLWSVVEAGLVLGGANKNRVIGMSLDVLLQILGTLERLAAELALVRLQRHMDTDMGSDVVPLDSGSAARVPLACQVQVVGALATNMALTDVLVERLRSSELLVAGIPAADEVVVRRRRRSALGSVGSSTGRWSRRLGVGAVAAAARGRRLR